MIKSIGWTGVGSNPDKTDLYIDFRIHVLMDKKIDWWLLKLIIRFYVSQKIG